MNPKQIKWIILLLPTVTIGLWEYIRHSFLLPYLSMKMGNILAPCLVFAVTIVFVSRLFMTLEKIQEELKEERSKQAAALEREQLARELHDGIAQMLFLLSVKLNKFEKKNHVENDEDYQKIKQTLKHIHDDTRQAISNLKHPYSSPVLSWKEVIKQYLQELKHYHVIDVHFNWDIDETHLSSKEKVELFACIKEAVTNVIKHAQTEEVWIYGGETPSGWVCRIIDRGIGLDIKKEQTKKGYGLQIMKERAKDMNWSFEVNRIENQTTIEIIKEKK
ncbi:histidine kinase [Priestia megaterium]|jgi:two-component system nitrate/nitrite sensor histidine kinase NarQ|uniref:sensor histidine kinase n=1 Tax=Priestia megaterium TaxID=1404 RepID=UPI002499BD1C|nr:histidine kinase [Priestia megaterium]MDI3089941.1 histidine kinase [Priestia megaterium]